MPGLPRDTSSHRALCEDEALVICAYDDFPKQRRYRQPPVRALGLLEAIGALPGFRGLTLHLTGFHWPLPNEVDATDAWQALEACEGRRPCWIVPVITTLMIQEKANAKFLIRYLADGFRNRIRPVLVTLPRNVPMIVEELSLEAARAYEDPVWGALNHDGNGNGQLWRDRIAAAGDGGDYDEDDDSDANSIAEFFNGDI